MKVVIGIILVVIVMAALVLSCADNEFPRSGFLRRYPADGRHKYVRNENIHRRL